jgi:hypothetical protein
MAGRLRRLLGRDRGADAADADTAGSTSGAGGPSIYAFIAAHIPATGPGLTEGGETLPDEPPPDDTIRFMAGALDGIMSHHGGSTKDQADVERVLAVVSGVAAGREPLEPLARVEERIGAAAALQIVDPLLERIQAARLPPQGLRELGRALATRSADRDHVKLGIAILGLAAEPIDRQVFMTLGRHDEFTLYCSVALQHTEPDPEGALWELAKVVSGWGRIHLVERLGNTQRPAIRDWILRTGFRNGVMDEYLARTAATTGGLVAALDQPAPDDELLLAACDIVSALINGGPAADIDDYADAPQALELLVGHLERRATTLHQLLAVDRIRRFLDPADERWANRSPSAWPVELREHLLARADAIVARPTWPVAVTEALNATDAIPFDEAIRAAEAVGVDTFDVELARLEEEPFGNGWYHLLEHVDAERLPRALAVAERGIPAAAIEGVPPSRFGFGPVYAPHRALSWVVNGLRRFPGAGWPLVALALQSPVLVDRSRAIGVLDGWDREVWPADAPAAAKAAAARETDPELRGRLELLAEKRAAPRS